MPGDQIDGGRKGFTAITEAPHQADFLANNVIGGDGRFVLVQTHQYHRPARHDRFDRLIADDTGADCIDGDIDPARVDCQRGSHGIGRFCINRMGSTPVFGHLEAGVRDIADDDLLDATRFGSGNHTQPNRASAEYQQGLAGLGIGQLDGMHGTGQWFCQ